MFYVSLCFSYADALYRAILSAGSENRDETTSPVPDVLIRHTNSGRLRGPAVTILQSEFGNHAN